MMAGARPSLLRGELVIENRREEPVCLERSEGLLRAGARLSYLRGELLN